METVTPHTPLTRKGLYRLVWARPLSAVARDLQISSSGLAKICDRLHIPCPPRGYWAKARAGLAPSRAHLPPSDTRQDEPVLISAERAASRTKRTRLPPAVRREQLLDAGADLIRQGGAQSATIRSVAQRVGISQSQAQNYFAQGRDLLIALARRELAAMETVRQGEIRRGNDRISRVTLSTVTYLRQAAERGALLQMLLSRGEVRDGLRAERAATSRGSTDQVVRRLVTEHGLPEDVARAQTVVLSAVTLRGGRLIAEGKISLELAERLTVPIVNAGTLAMTRVYGGAETTDAAGASS